MKAERQQKERTSRVIQSSKQNKGSLNFVDNRFVQRKVIQLAIAVTDDTMDSTATDIMGGESRSTLAITKEDTKYKWYSQGNIGSKKAEIKTDYSNLDEGLEGPGVKGLHAEMVACGNSTGISRIAASQPICKRCAAYLDSKRITKVNAGSQFTSDWVAPTMDNVTVVSTYPGQAQGDSSRDGLSGRRYIIDSGNYKPCAKTAWMPKHLEGW